MTHCTCQTAVRQHRQKELSELHVLWKFALFGACTLYRARLESSWCDMSFPTTTPLRCGVCFFANAVSCCECGVLLGFCVACLGVLSRNHCDLFYRFWESCRDSCMYGERCALCFNFLHVVPVQISCTLSIRMYVLHLGVESGLNWSCCLSCGVCHAPRFENTLSLVCLRMVEAYFPREFRKGQNCSHSKIAVCNGFFCLSS